MLELENIYIALPCLSNGKQTSTIGYNVLIKQFSYQLKQGEIISFMGASGSGKSSLLGYIAGFLEAPFIASGEIILNGELMNPLPAHQRNIGILFQDALLFPHLSVGENLAFALPARMAKQQKQAEIMQALSDCNMQDYHNADPASLSGGQKARVGLMRALLAKPACLLLDEPFSKLDATLRDEFRDFVFGHINDKKLPAILVSHDIEDAQKTGGEIFSMADF